MYIVYRILTEPKYKLRNANERTKSENMSNLDSKVVFSLGEIILCTALLLYNVVMRVKKYT